MTDTPSALVRLDAHQSDNWISSTTPVAILNTESTLHERVAYCWGLATQLHVLSDLLAQHENPEIQQVAAQYGFQLIPLMATLHKIGSDTQPGESVMKT